MGKVVCKIPGGGETHGSKVAIPTLTIVGQHAPAYPICRLNQGN